MKITLDQSSRPEGCEVYHFRCLREESCLQCEPETETAYVKTRDVEPCGGATVVLSDDGAFGVAICSHRDTFSRSRGRQIAYGRLLTRNTARRQFWGRLLPIPKTRLDRMKAMACIANVSRLDLPAGCGCPPFFVTLKKGGDEALALDEARKLLTKRDER